MFFYTAKKKNQHNPRQITAMYLVHTTWSLAATFKIQTPPLKKKKSRVKRFCFRLKKSKSPCSLFAPATSHPQQQHQPPSLPSRHLHQPLTIQSPSSSRLLLSIVSYCDPNTISHNNPKPATISKTDLRWPEPPLSFPWSLPQNRHFFLSPWNRDHGSPP